MIDKPKTKTITPTEMKVGDWVVHTVEDTHSVVQVESISDKLVHFHDHTHTKLDEPYSFSLLENQEGKRWAYCRGCNDAIFEPWLQVRGFCDIEHETCFAQGQRAVLLVLKETWPEVIDWDQVNI